MSLKTPLGRVLGLGTARDGTDHFVSQRLSAMGLALLGTWFVVSMFLMPGMTYLDVIRFIEKPMNAVLLTLLSFTLAYHSSLGVQVVIEDYVHSAAAKQAALVASRFAHVVVGVAAAYAVLRIGLNA